MVAPKYSGNTIRKPPLTRSLKSLYLFPCILYLIQMNPVILIGVGEMGGVFARGLLRTGHTVVPVTRGTDVQALASEIPAPLMVLVAVAEADLHAVLESVPPGWRERLALLQNELLPRDWKQHGLDAPTVISVWFEKNKG